MSRRLKVNSIVSPITAVTVAAALLTASGAVAYADTASQPGYVTNCTTLLVKVPSRHWVRKKLTRKIHGRRVVVRRHGKIVYHRAYVRYLRTESRQSCTSLPLPATVPAPSTATSTGASLVSEVVTSPPAPAPPPPPAPASAPVGAGAPTLSGVAKSGEALSASSGAWSESPTAYAYQWQRCDAEGNACTAIAGANSSTYTLSELDGAKTVRVSVTASNASGSSAPVSSAQSAIVLRAYSSTFGKTSVGVSSDKLGADRKRVIRYSLPSAGSISQLNAYLQPSGAEGQQLLRGVIYSDSSGKPAALLGTTNELAFHSNERAGWRTLAFPAPIGLPAGAYWIGLITGATANVTSFRYDSVANSRDFNANAYSAGPSDPFGAHETDSEQMSIYASYASRAPLAAPVNAAAPTVSGVTQTEQELTAAPGSWSDSPTGFAYQWQRCDSAGANCSAIAAATAPTYKLEAADLNHRLRVSTIASNAAGASTPVISAASPAVSSSAGSHHLEYVLNVGVVSVYDMDHEWKSVGTISLPQAVSGIRGVTVSPSTHVMFVSYGGDGAGYGPGSVLAYDLVTDEVLWTTDLSTGIDSGQVSPDGQLLYMPTGEQSSGTVWNVLSAADGELVKTISGGMAPHNTIASHDGEFVYLGGRYSEYLSVYNTKTGQVRQIGPVTPGVRPFTVNGSNTLAFTTATEYDGFQVSSIATGKVLFTTSFGPVPPNLPDSAPSHGISLSPNEKQLYVVDDVNKEIQVYDVSKVAEGVAPAQIGVVAVAGLEGIETPCGYDCGRGGWLQRSTDGHYVLVGDSGDVIETATRKVVANLPTLLNTKISIEIDWANGVPVATSGRSGVGEVP